MENRDRNIDQLIANRLKECPTPTHAPELQGRIMVAVEREARRRKTLHSVKIVALGVLLAAVAVGALLGALALANELFGLEYTMATIDRYMEELVGMLGFIAQRYTFRLLVVVFVMLEIIMFISRRIGFVANLPKDREER